MNKKKVNRILNVFFATRLKVFLACVAMLLFWQNTFSQTYPVQVQTTTKPPYYNYLAYYGDFNNNLSFVATLLDFNAPPVSVRLRLKISGPGYSYRTRTDIPVGNVFVLSPGMPTFIQGNDLLPYFNPVNLVAEQGTVNWNNMPEGLTTFCVEVIKVGVNNEVLSAESCSSFFLQLMQPPQPFLPFCNSTVDTTQMFHTFSWSPPLNYTPAFGAELNYNFSLYEWLDTNNYNIFQTGQGLVFSTQTQVPLVQVSNFDVLFQAGRKYVWRVQAQLSQNGLPIQMITQNGLSVPCSFYYGQPQSLAGSLASGLQINLNAQAQSERKGTASWTVVNTSGNGLSGFSSYILEYRKKPTGNENFEFYWFTDTVYSLSKAIYQLEPSTTYECRLRGVFGDYTSDYTPIVEFTTAPPYEYTCGDQNMPWMSAQFTPLAQAEAGMVWQIGQFSMKVTAIYGSDGNGRFSGAGRIPVEFLAGAQAQVTFVDILVDNEFNVREGVANVNTSGVDAWLHAQYAQFVQPIYVDGVVDTAYVQDGVAFVVVDGQTLQFEFDPPDYPIIIHDDNGVSYTIYPDGTVAVGSYFVISQDELQTDAEGAAVFAQHEQEQFGFDPKEHNQWHDNYEIILLQDESHYFVSNKSLALGFGDEVRVFVPASTTNPTAKLPNGTSLGLVLAPSSGGQQGGAYYNLSLPPFYSQGTYSVYIHDGLDRIGKLNIEVFNLKEKEVYIVPIASPTASLSDIEDHAKRIFAEANMQLTVEVLDAWSNDNFNASTSIAMPENVGNLDKYSEDMRALRDAYFSAHPNLPKDAYYVFVVAGFNNPDEQGYMVRGKSIGFVKANAPPRTYAHELAHGITALKHTWNNNGPAQGSTNNLMDYGGGENLTKAQWQAMRSWNLLPSFWDGEEEGMAYSAYLSSLEPLKDENNLYTFIAPDKSVFTLDESTQYVVFSSLDRFIFKNDDTESNYLAPVGSVLSFKNNGINYEWVNSGWSGNGFYEKTNTNPNPQKYIDGFYLNSSPPSVITSIFTAHQDNGELKTVFFRTDISSFSSQSFIAFDNGTISHDVSLSAFVSAHKINNSPFVYQDLSAANFGSQGTILSVLLPNDSLVIINPFNVFKISGASISVAHFIHYLELCNFKKDQWQIYSECVKDEYLRIGLETFQQIFTQCSLSVSNTPVTTYEPTKQELYGYFQNALDNAFDFTQPETYNSLNSLLNNPNTPISEIKSWLNQRSSCITLGLPVSTRAKAIHKLLTNDSYWDVALRLLNEMPESHTYQTNFANAFCDYKQTTGVDWIALALPQLHNTWEPDGDDIQILGQIMGALFKIQSVDYSNPRFATTHYNKILFDPLNPTSTTDIVSYNALSQPIFFAKAKTLKELPLEPGSNMPLGLQFDANQDIISIVYQGGKVKVSQKYKIKDITDVVSNPDYVADYVEFNIQYELNPYELVSVQFLDNYASALGYDAGTNIQVPAYYLLFFNESIDHADWQYNFRVVTDAIEIGVCLAATISAPFTFGGSLAVLGAVAATYDLSVAANQYNAPTSELPIYQDWDAFYGYFQLAVGAGAAYTLVKGISLPRTLVHLRKFKRNLANLPSNASSKLLAVRNLLAGSSFNGGILSISPSWLPNRIIAGNLDNPAGLIGCYEKQLPSGTWIRDTKNALDDLDFPETFASNFVEASKDGFKMLRVNQFYFSDLEQFWNNFNLPWLNALVNSGADIVVLSDKSDDLLKYKWQIDPTTNAPIFETIPGTTTRVKTGFGKEIEFMDNLVQQGVYQWDEVNGMYKFIGN